MNPAEPCQSYQARNPLTLKCYPRATCLVQEHGSSTWSQRLQGLRARASVAHPQDCARPLPMSRNSGRIGFVFPFERPPIGERSSVGLNFKPACRNGRFHPEKAPAFAPRCRGGGGRCSLCLPWLPGRARVCKLWGLPVPRCCLGPSRSLSSCTSPVQGGSRAFLENAAELDCRTWPMGEAK